MIARSWRFKSSLPHSKAPNRLYRFGAFFVLGSYFAYLNQIEEQGQTSPVATEQMKLQTPIRRIVTLLVALAVGTGCVSRYDIKPDSLTGFETEKEKTVIVPIQGQGATGNFSVLGFETRTFYFETAEGRIVKVEGEPSVIITTSSGSEEYEYPIRVEMEPDRFRIYSGNLAPADYEKSDIESVVLSEYDALMTRLLIGGIVVGAVLVTAVLLFGFSAN